MIARSRMPAGKSPRGQDCEDACLLAQAVAGLSIGLVLVDTKYEFGLLPDGTVALIDEIHTPDSSRFWVAATLEDRRAAEQEPENFDKEFLRKWFVDQGYRGEGPIPRMPPEFVVQVANRYIAAYEKLTGQIFVPGETPAAARIARNLADR